MSPKTREGYDFQQIFLNFLPKFKNFLKLPKFPSLEIFLDTIFNYGYKIKCVFQNPSFASKYSYWAFGGNITKMWKT